MGNQQQTTDVNGIVTFQDVVVNENFAYAQASAFGYVSGSRVMVPQNQNSFTIKLFNITEGQSISSEGGEIEINSGENGTTFIEFGSGFIDENGNSYNGTVNVVANYLDPLNPETAETMPGELYGLDSNFQEVALGSYGMISVELRGSSGEELQITNPAEIRIPIHPDQTGIAPGQVPMWSFNEDTGVWIEETVAQNNGTHFVAQVTHFSFWNCDAPFPVVDFDATVTDTSSNPLAGLRVTITYNNFARYAFTDSNGVVSGKIPSGQTMNINITDQCGTSLYNNSFGPFSSATSVTIPVTLSTTPITVSGTVVDCSSATVTNGYVTYTNGSGQYLGIAQVTAGTHSYSGISCSTPVNVTLTGGDSSTGQIISPTTVVANPSATANLVACGGTASEFIRYRINGGPYQYDLINPNGGVEPPNYLFVAAGSPAVGSQGATYIVSNTTTLGTYPFDHNVFSITTPSFSIRSLSHSSGIDEVATTGTAGAVTFALNNFGPVGTYIDIQFAGNYVDQTGAVQFIEGDAHVIRDN